MEIGEYLCEAEKKVAAAKKSIKDAVGYLEAGWVAVSERGDQDEFERLNKVLESLKKLFDGAQVTEMEGLINAAKWRRSG